jgi:prenylcysteine oxidase/farnesylcysteine lyase
VQSVTIRGHVHELGAGIYHQQNKHLHGWAKEFDLPVTGVRGENSGSVMGIWNGREFVVETSPFKLLTIARFLWRYGLSAPRLDAAAAIALDRWMTIYEALDNQGTSFDTVEALLGHLNLTSHLAVSTLTHLRDTSGCSEKFIDELVSAITRGIYNQYTDEINALAGLISFLGTDAKRLYHFKEGNRKVIEALLSNSRVELHLNTTVASVHADKSPLLLVDSMGKEHRFDGVILSSPLEQSAIKLHGVSHDLPARQYQTTAVHLVVAKNLKSSFFGLPDGSWLPSEIGTTGNRSIPFGSLALRDVGDDGLSVYHLSADHTWTDSELDTLFEGREATQVREWKAYPVLPANPKTVPFKLSKGLCYSSAFEVAASAMEVMALGGKNCVNMLKRDLRRTRTCGADGKCSES